jgi:hypothetical protein
MNNEISKIIHYPDCWDTVAYPSLIDAVHEIVSCNFICECQSGKLPDYKQLCAELLETLKTIMFEVDKAEINVGYADRKTYDVIERIENILKGEI